MLLMGLALLTNLFFFRGIFFGLVPIPLDALVGVYHPWADFFWGFVAGVPYKNMALTDVFSQLYPWRMLAMNLVRSWQLPLWNPYSFMGGPLLANWQSAPFYPLNLLMLIFGNVFGYGLMVSVQPLMALIFMILYLREIKVSKTATYIGSISFAFGGFMMTYLEYSTTGQILTMIPLSLYLIEKYLVSNKRRYLLGLVVAEFCIFTGGFFQPALYALLLISIYVVVSSISRTKKLFSGSLFELMFSMIIGVGLSAIQLVPTFELLNLSIRNLDHNIIEYKYGLLPIKQLLALLAPDIFGNSTTGNYFGFMQYQETSGYFGIVATTLAITALFNKKKDYRQLFFIFFFLFSLLMAFNNPVSQLVFQFKLPFLSTGYASRWLMITTFAGSVLAAYGFDRSSKKLRVGVSLVVLLAIGCIYLLVRGAKLDVDPVHILIATRNLVLPLILVTVTVVLFFLPKKNLFLIAFCLLVSFDLLRYATKFTPFVNKAYGTTEIPFITRIKQTAGINRVAIDKGPLMPANTWIYNDIFTIGGYDPLLYKDSEVWFRAINVGNNPNQKIDGSLGNGSMTRYLNLDNPYSPLLDLAGAKYLLTLKIDTEGRFKEGGKINGELLKKYQPVDDFGGTVLLENKSAMSRVNLFYEAESEMNDAMAAEKLIAGFDFRNIVLLKSENLARFSSDKHDGVSVLSYSANKVTIRAQTKNGAYLMLSDTDYPGWRVRINGKDTKIIRADGIFRAVELPPGEVRVEFYYFPNSFLIGLTVSVSSLFLAIGIAIVFVLKKRF